MDIRQAHSDCAAIQSRIEHHLDVVLSISEHNTKPNPNDQLREVSAALDSANHLNSQLAILRRHFVGCALAYNGKVNVHVDR